MKRAAWAALAFTEGVGGRTVTRLLRVFGDLDTALEASPEDLIRLAGFSPALAHRIASADSAIAAREIEHFAAQGIRLLTWLDADFPPLLLRCEDTPFALFVRGQPLPAHERLVAVVGTRTPSPPGGALARDIAFYFAARGWCVVSGLALGIDTQAHLGALDAGGVSLGVPGAGLASIYPARNAALAEQIMERGALLNEFHPDAPVSAQRLRARNRISSGLCRATIVIEGAADSGSAATARLALRQGRLAVIIGPALPDLPGAISLHPANLDLPALESLIESPPEPGPAQLPLC